MFVVSAVAIASASAALPEFESTFPKHFVALQTTNGFLETKAGRTVECKHGSALGLINSAKDLLVNGIIYTECKSTAFGGGVCLSTGAPEGEIKTNRLLGLLGYIAKPNVGILFEPDNAPDFATFHCKTLLGTESLLVRGTVICPLSPVNTTTDKYTLDCKMKAGEKGVQEPLSFEGAGTTDTLMTEGKGPENFAFEQSGVSASSEVLTLGTTKINA
jgi:hypothetical protein